MTQEEQIPLPFCTGASLPIICSHYAASESSDVAERILSSSVNYNPTFISEGKHIDLIMKLRGTPLLFSATRLWVMPLEYKSVVPRRLDNNILFYEKNETGGLNVYESYCVKNDEQGAITNMLFHLSVTGENKPEPKLNVKILDQRSNMNGAILKNSFKDHRKNVVYTYNKNGNIIKTEGMYIDILDILQDKLNFVTESMLLGKVKWGKRLKNGTWTGIIGMLIEGKLDLQVGSTASYEKYQVLDFCWKFDESKISLMSAKSTAPKLDIWAYMTIFPISAWVIGFPLILVAGLCFSLSSQEPIPKGLTLTGRLLLQMGYDVQTKGIASKSILLIAAVSLNLIFIYFCSDLTSKMTSEPSTLNIRSFQDIERKGFRLITRKGSSNRLLRTAPQGTAMRRMYDDGNYLAIDEEEMMSFVMNNPKTVVLGFESGWPNLVVLDITENLATAKSLAFKKDSELTKIFNNNLLKMQEFGLINRIKKKWYGDHNQVFEMSEPLILTFDNLFFPFGCLALGILFTILITAAEIIVKKFL